MSFILIDDNLRTMTIPTDIVLLGVESDDDVNKIPFKMPKSYCGYDLSTFEIRINYMNANDEGDLYIVQDATVDGDNITFTWLVGRTACKYMGYTKFIVCLKKFADDDSGTVLQEFNTTVYRLPVLQGLETVEAVVQNYPDAIEYILQRITDAGLFDPTQYYTKSQIDGMIPTELPNPEALIINGVTYDGSEEKTITIEASSEYQNTVSGKILHVVDAIPQAVESLKMYDSGSSEIASATICVANKNLFRSDSLASQVTSKTVLFTRSSADGSVSVVGTSSGANAMSSCSLDKHIFVIGKTYTLSSGKSVGYASVQLAITYADTSTDTIVSQNSARTFTIEKEVSSVTASIVVAESGTTVNEVVYPMLELADSASAYVKNEFSSATYDGTVLPVLPDVISNVWSSSDTVASLTMEYDADSVYAKIDAYARENLGSGGSGGGSLVATYDGSGTVTLGLA